MSMILSSTESTVAVLIPVEIIMFFVAKKDKPLVLYPAYFDSGRSRAEGRRVSRNLAVPAPKVEELHSATKALGLQAVIDPDKAHSTTPWEKEGRILIQDNYVKTSVLKKIAEKLKEMRS